MAGAALRGARKALPAVSKKRAKLTPERTAFRERILRERPYCEAWGLFGDALADATSAEDAARLTALRGQCRMRSVDVHEIVKRGRSGVFVPSQGLADSDVLALCRRCHDFTESDPSEATKYGLLRSRGADDADA